MNSWMGEWSVGQSVGRSARVLVHKVKNDKSRARNWERRGIYRCEGKRPGLQIRPVSRRQHSGGACSLPEKIGRVGSGWASKEKG